jgi:hypothetical protein
MTAPLVQQRYLTLMQNTVATLGHVLKHVTPQQATTLRDGPQGWTVLEVVCHLRDYDEIFYQRAIMTLEQDNPTLPAYDQEALAVERAYNQQNLEQAYADLAARFAPAAGRLLFRADRGAVGARGPASALWPFYSGYRGAAYGLARCSSPGTNYPHPDPNHIGRYPCHRPNALPL